MKRYVELPIEDVEAAIVAHVEAKGLKPAYHGSDPFCDGPRQLRRRMVCLGRRTDEKEGVESVFVLAVQVEIEADEAGPSEAGDGA